MARRLAVTIYDIPSKEGQVLAKYAVSAGDGPILDQGDMMQSKVFDLQDGWRLLITPVFPVEAK